jgi:Spy/CpxP family protein refolding chaperone
MRKIIYTLLLLTTTHSAFSQVRREVQPTIPSDSSIAAGNTGTKADRAEMVKALNLTDAQKKAFKEVNQSLKTDRSAIQADTNLSEEEKKQKMNQLRVSYLEKMKDILSPEQFEKFKQMRKSRPMPDNL